MPDAILNRPTQLEWERKGTELFGVDKERWRFVCPTCGNVMSIERARAEFPELKGSGWAPHQECAGRYVDRVKTPRGKRCDWCAYGLFSGPVFVKTPDLKEIAVFDFEGLPFTGKRTAAAAAEPLVALSFLQPWLWAILERHKGFTVDGVFYAVENRSRPPRRAAAPAGVAPRLVVGRPGTTR